MIVRQLAHANVAALRNGNRKKLRILVGMPDSESTGGPAACEPPFVSELRRAGLEVEEEVYAHADRTAHPSLWTRMKRVLRTAQTLRRRLNTERFDVVHLNTSFDTRALMRDVVTIFFMRSTKSKIFLKFHGSDADLLKTGNPLLRFLTRLLLKRADGIGVLSSEEKNNFVRAGVDVGRVFLVKNAVQEIVSERDPSFNERQGIDDGVPALLFIARFIQAKGLLDVIRACRMVRERGFQLVLLCVGDGPARAEAELEVERTGLQACVRFCGFVPEEQTTEFYVNSAMLVFPTYHYEGFPMVIFNAMAAGIPVITTRIRAAADYLSEPDNCLWVEPRNPSMLAEKIIYLLTDALARVRMGQRNRELARSFTAEAITPDYIAIYRSL